MSQWPNRRGRFSLEGCPIYPADFPFEAHFLTVNGRRMAYLDAGEGERTILMVHGNPVAGYVYERVMRLLVGQYRCVVPDLIGFGLSEKPFEEGHYSLRGHIEDMSAFIERLDLQNVALVGHDWGGPIGFAAALQARQRFSHLVVLNTITEVPLRIMPVYWLPFHLLRLFPRLASYLIKERNLFQKMGVAIMEPQDQAFYFRANHSPQTRAGIAAFPRMIPYKKSHANTALLGRILRDIKTWPIPSLVMFSDRDSVFSAEQGLHFAAQMQQARFVLVPGAKHFLQYQRPQRVADEIIKFLGAGL